MNNFWRLQQQHTVKENWFIPSRTVYKLKRSYTCITYSLQFVKLITILCIVTEFIMFWFGGQQLSPPPIEPYARSFLHVTFSIFSQASCNVCSERFLWNPSALSCCDPQLGSVKMILSHWQNCDRHYWCRVLQPAWKTKQMAPLTSKGIESSCSADHIEQLFYRGGCLKTTCDFSALPPAARWRTVSCQTRPTGASQTLSTTSKQQGSRSKPLLSRIR